MITDFKKLVSIMVITVVLFTAVTALCQDERKPPESIDLSESIQHFDSYSFQRSIISDKNISNLADQASFLDEQSTSFGFGGKSLQARFFLIGTLYSEAMANLQGDDPKSAEDKLDIIRTEFISLNAPPALYNYVNQVINFLKTGKYNPEIVMEFMAMFQPLLHDYAMENGNEKGLMFQAGLWFVNAGLAAAAGDETMLGTSAKFKYFLTEFQRLEAPKGALDALKSLVEITEKKKMSESDLDEARKLINKVQLLLS
jgi:hypothetical protein